jgi:glycosyltransferase involved in cell wall biosynthesis
MLFSIITPSYRQLDWLNLCAASIADQDVDVEHLVQDAGSPGIEAWTQSHPGVKVTVEADAGMYDAINRGLRRAQGEICAYLNCDEQYLPGTLKKVGDYFKCNPSVDVLFGDAILADAQLQPLAYRTAILPSRWHTLLRPLAVLTCSTFFRRKIVDAGALFDPSWKIIGDKAWILQLLDRGYRLAVLPEPLAMFAFTGTNLSHLPSVMEERARWDRSYPAALSLAKPWIMSWHVFKKWQWGAYRPHALTSSWYTPNSLHERRSYTELTLGWKWPSVSSLSAS